MPSKKGRIGLQETLQEPGDKINNNWTQESILFPEYPEYWELVEEVTNCFLGFRFPNTTSADRVEVA